MSTLRNRKKGSPNPPSESLMTEKSPAKTPPLATGKQGSLIRWASFILLCVGLYLAVLYTKTDNASLQSASKTSASRKLVSLIEQESIQGKRCSVYMAPSSIKGIDGYGIFTTKPLPKGSYILKGPDGPGIPVIDYYEEHNHDWYYRQQFIRTFYKYWWARGVSDHVTFEADQVIDFQITFGSLPNHHCILESLDVAWPRPFYDDSLVASHEPGAGAFSYHLGRNFLVSVSMNYVIYPVNSTIKLTFTFDTTERLGGWR